MTMLQWNAIASVLAQANPGPAEAPPMGQLMVYLMGGLVIFTIVQLLFGRTESKERARREQLIGSLKKNDPVVTIGGILGNVVSVSEDKSEVTIRVDDSTRLKVQAAAIREVLVRENKDGKEAKEKSGE